MSYYNRKSPRISNYDYSNPNYFFITICAHHRKCLFGTVSELNPIGKIVRDHIIQIPGHYQHIRIDKYVVMPNHIHLILCLPAGGNNDARQVIGQFKSGVTRAIRAHFPNMQVWQRSFHDHVIRNDEDYRRIWNYIDGNPLCWEKDCFFVDHN